MRRKKFRGFRRYFRWYHQQARATIPAAINWEWLARYDQYYIKVIDLEPWGIHPKPPQAIRQDWIKHLVRTFHHWNAQLQALYPSYYLALEIQDPKFGESRLQIAMGEARRLYKNERWKTHPLKLPLPKEYQTIPEIQPLQWQAYAKILEYEPDEFAEAGKRLLHKPHWSRQSATGEHFLEVQFGRIWIGTLGTLGLT
jgi:hypothetical protein